MSYLHFKVPMPPSLRSPDVIDDFDKAKIASCCRGAKLHKKTRYDIEVIFHSQWDNQDGSPKRKDVHNYFSKLADVLCPCLDIDDSQFENVTLRKMQNTEDQYADVSIRECRWRRCA